MMNFQIHSTVVGSNFNERTRAKLDVLVKRCAGLDVHAKTIVACVLVEEDDGYLIKEIETFRTLTKDLFTC